MSSIAQNVRNLLEQLDGWSGTVVAVTKTTDTSGIQQAYAEGLRHFAENRVQVLAQRRLALTDEVLPQAYWHLIGPLQQNKVTKVVGQGIHLIQSVDSLPIAHKIHQVAKGRSVTQPVLLQVNLAREPQKSGFLKEQLESDFPELIQLEGIAIRGLMLIAPQGAQADSLKRLFTGLNRLRMQLQDRYACDLPELSMGMSQDFEHAIACGATIIRVGSRLFL